MLNQLYSSSEITGFTLLLSCIYCAWTSQSHFTAFHRNYINWYTQSHQNLSSKNKNIFIPYMYAIKSWLHFQETTIKENSVVLDSSKISSICCFPLNERTPPCLFHTSLVVCEVVPWDLRGWINFLLFFLHSTMRPLLMTAFLPLLTSDYPVPTEVLASKIIGLHW